MKHAARLAILVCVALTAVPAALAASETIAPRNVWPHTDVAPDPGVVLGTLPNGMRYLIKRNTTPAHTVSMAFRMASGSLEETDSEEGMSHLLEHMAFRGSKHFPDGQVITEMERVGVALGSDSNAFTYPDSTTFSFNFPSNDPAALDKGFLFARDIADGLTLDPKALDSERAVVLAEIREKDTLAFRDSKQSTMVYLGANLARGMSPLGTPSVIQNVTAEQLRAFYQAHYRPESATLFVVGDIDPKIIEAKIKALFSDWTDAAPAPPPPNYAFPAPLGHPAIRLSAEAGFPSFIQLMWATPYDTAPHTLASEKRDAVRAIAIAVLNQRLAALANGGNPPFVNVGARHGASYGAIEFTSIAASYPAQNALAAVRAIRDTYADALRNGVKQDEVDRAVAGSRAGHQSFAATAGTIPNQQWMGQMLIATALDGIIMSPEQMDTLFESEVKNLTAQDVTAALRELLAGDPAVIVVSPVPLKEKEADFAAIFAAPIAASGAVAAAPLQPWPYTDFGPPGKILSTRTIPDLGLTLVTFANGVRATIKPTHFLADQISIAVHLGTGKFGMAKKGGAPDWALAAWVGGGVKRITTDESMRLFAGREMTTSFTNGPYDDELLGQTRRADFQTQLQFLAAYLSDPAWRKEGFERMQAAMQSGLQQAETAPAGVMALHFGDVIHNDDPRWRTPTVEQVGATRLEDVIALYQSRVADAPMAVTVVGDISAEDAIKGLAASFGALPKRPMLTGPRRGDEQGPQPEKSPFIFRYHGAQSVAMIGWSTTDAFAGQTPAALAVLARVLSKRLFDELRTREGITYTPQVQSIHSAVTPGYGFFAAMATLPAAKLQDFYDSVAKTVSDLRSKPISDDELKRARDPLVGDIQQAEQTNGYWLSSLMDAQIDPRRLDLIRQNLPDVQAVTATDLQHAAQTYLTDNKAWKIMVVPDDYAMKAATN